MIRYKKTVLPNGVRVVTESHPNSRAAVCGIWACTGTRDERQSQMGITHFVEHLVFKGTRKRNAYRLAHVMESVGGDLNAYTTREYTCFHTTSLREHMALSLDILQDLVVDANFPPKEIPREKQVVLQEILQSEDNPDELVYDLFQERVFGKHPLGWPILGSESTIEEMSRRDVVSYYKSRFRGRNLIVSAAGNVDHQEVVDLVSKKLGRTQSAVRMPKRKRPRFHPFRKIIEKETEQVQIIVAFPAPSFKSRDRFEAFILNALLGGGMTSRLYQSIRERRGLAYSVYSQLTTFTDTGLLMIHAGTDPKRARTVVNVIRDQVEKLKSGDLREADIDLFKTQVRGGILLGADDVENRMNSLGVNEMVFEKYRSVEDVIEEMDQVSLQSVKACMKRSFHDMNPAILLMGNLPDKDRSWLEESW